MVRQALTQQVHDRLARYVSAGDVVIDATCGNGHDTLFLAGLVAENGTVYACDDQQVAIDAARKRLFDAGMDRHVRWINAGHETLTQSIPVECHGRIAAVVFNLGYLPGSDKLHVTQAPTTLLALQQARSMLRSGGVISVMVYTEHRGGEEEAALVRQWAERNSWATYEVLIPQSRRRSPPQWYWLVNHID